VYQYSLATHCCVEECNKPGAGLIEHNRWAIEVCSAYGDIAAQPHLEAARKRGQIKTLEDLK
jgi:hypothetical protein